MYPFLRGSLMSISCYPSLLLLFGVNPGLFDTLCKLWIKKIVKKITEITL